MSVSRTSSITRASITRARLSNLDLAGFCLVLALLLISGVVGIYNVRHLSATNERVAHTYDVIGAIETTLSTLKDGETGQRGYLLTENDSYLEPFNSALDAIASDMDRIRELTKDNSDQNARFTRIEATVDKRLEELKQTVASAKNGDRQGAINFVLGGTGKQTMDALRNEVSELKAVELKLLADRIDQAKNSLNSTIGSILASTLLGLALTGTVMFLTRKNIQQRQRLLDSVSEQKERLRTTLASIGDGVITTDREGLVTNLNPVAESLTGWANDTAAGQPLVKVFNIVNETSRLPVPNPASRSLEEGTIVGLANHTILIAADGTERSIDDSAAPIRNAEGEIIGAVLVFRDISERRRLENQVAERLSQARLLASIVESSSDAIISKSLDGIIQSWNKGAQRLFGFAAEESVGKHISMLIPPERMADEEEFLRQLSAGEAIRHFETVRRTRDGQFVDVSINLSPILDDAGRVIAASKIARDISERKKVEEQLRQLAAELSESGHRKDEFLATLAHELRNPLAPIRNGLHVIQNASGDEKTVEEARNIIERQVTQLVRLVDDLLDVSRISRGKLEMRRQPIDIADAIKIAVETCRPVIDESRHSLNVIQSSTPITVNADLIRLAQVFANLLNNSAKYSEAGGQIVLQVERRAEVVEVSVKDNGIGIPAEMLGNIFEMFTQVDGSLERSQGGLGIGLTLVKRLVEMHDGTVSAKSDGPGTGSEFIVCLPVTSAPNVPLSATTKAVEAAVNSAKILVADDNKDSARTLSLILSFMGHKVETAYDGVEAVELAEAMRPEIILLDIGMPKLNGYEACRRIREKPWGKSTLIIALTGWGQDEDRRLSREAGFSHHLVKPVDVEKLKQLLATSKSQS